MTDKEIIESYGKYLVAWLQGNPDHLTKNKKVSSILKKTMTRISTYNSPIYRGLRLHQDDVIKILNGESVSLLNRGLESWTADPNVAKQFSIAFRAKYVSCLISKKAPKKGTVIIDFTNDIVRNALENYMEGLGADLSEENVITYMDDEKELVTTPQCVKCRLTDMELVRLTRFSSTELVNALGFNRTDIDFVTRGAHLVGIRQKSKHVLLNPTSNANSISIPWKRKPNKSMVSK